MASKKSNSAKIAAGIGTGLAALAAATAGAYFLYGKDASKNKKKIKGWMLKAKGEILDQLEKMKEVSEDTYQEVIDRVSAKYKAIKSVDPAEIDQMVKELKGHWRSISKQIAEKPAPKKKIN